MSDADLAEFERAVRALRNHPVLKPRIRGGQINFVDISTQGRVPGLLNKGR